MEASHLDVEAKKLSLYEMSHHSVRKCLDPCLTSFLRSRVLKFSFGCGELLKTFCQGKLYIINSKNKAKEKNLDSVLIANGIITGVSAPFSFRGFSLRGNRLTE